MRLEKFVWTAVAASVALLIGTAPIDATTGQSAKPKQTVKTTPKPKTTTGATKVKTTSSPKAQASAPKIKKTAPAPKVNNAKNTTKPAKSMKPTTTKGSSQTTKGSSKKTSTASTSTTTTDTATSAPTDTTGGDSTATTEPLSKAQLQLTKNTKLQAKMQQRLGLADGDAVIAAASGFKNLGQFVAAANVSNNLGIPFDDLKLAMTGIDPTGVKVNETTMSLGQAIQSLKGLDSTTATTTANTATTQANAEIQGTDAGGQ